MKDHIKVNCCAKINLTLDVLKVRPDRYHEIKSIMQSVDLKDTIYLERGGRDIELFCSYFGVPEDPKNFAFIAAQKFREKAGIREGLVIKIDKKIPVAAGLGGGSADAAAVLVGLNNIFRKVFSPKELLALAAEVGSDVPFFLAGGAALVTGRGEKIKSLPSLPKCVILIIKPQLEISTAWAYEHYDLDKFSSGRYTDKCLKALASKSLKKIGKLLGNDLEQPVFKKHGQLKQLRELLMSQKEILGVVMSGSGSAFLAFVRNKALASRLSRRLRKEGHEIFITQPTRKALEVK